MGAQDKQGGRRRFHAGQLPAHYCTRCTTVALEEDATCLECGSARPKGGWSPIQDGFDAWLGRVLDGRYLVTRQLGQGSEGLVYRADSLAISRDFAIKIINYKQAPSGISADQIRSRLHREIEALGRLRNPHVVPFYEVIELFDAFIGVVMDYIEGETLEQMVAAGGPLPPRRALTLLRQMANGIHEAHEAGMIHRDLKPENIMVERMPAGDDFVHILDFGIVRLDDGVSMTRGFVGTPLYASPEQAMAGDIDRRSDIYTLGAILFFLLTGRPPYVSENLYEVLQAHVRSAVPTLGEAAPERVFPPALEALLVDMLAKSPERRPGNLSTVIDRLDALLRSPELAAGEAFGRESMELTPISRDHLDTGAQRAVGLGRGRSPGLDHHSDAAFMGPVARQLPSFSKERDPTGPRAGIFRRTPSNSRSTVRKLVAQDRKAHRQTLVADHVVREDVGELVLGPRLDAAIVRCAAAGDDGIALLDADGHVFRVQDRRAELLAREQRQISALAVSPQTVLLGHTDGTVTSLDLSGVATRQFQDVRQAVVTAVASDRRGRIILAGSESGRIYMQRRPGDWQRIQDGPPVVAITVDEAGGVFAVARKHREIELFDVSRPRSPFMRFSVPAFPTSIAFSRDGHLIACLLDDDSIILHAALTGRRVVSIRDEANRLRTLAFNERNELLGYFERGGVLYGLDLQRELTNVGA